MTTLLSVEHLTKDFAGLRALHDVSFDVGEAEIVGIIGPNGAGKSTLFNCVAGMFPPTAGRVMFAGRDITGAEAHQLARMGMARTFQLMKPFVSMTTADNVVVAALSHHRRVADARNDALRILDRVGLGAWADRRSEDLPTAGRKRLELARALALRPRLLLLDEVMSGLVPTERAPVIELLLSLRDEGVTMVFVEHVMQAVMTLADRIVVLHHGELLASGTADVVTADPKVIEAYLGEESIVSGP